VPAVKILVLYPRPTDINTFEKLYQNEHVPLAVEKLAGSTKFVATRVLGSLTGTPPFHRVAEIYFPSMEALEACAASEGGQQTVAHARSISTGGDPLILIAEEDTFTFA
jgi:uncharacterized protein (TIGR02118 family)